MARKLSSSDRKALIRLAYKLPAGSKERKTILAAVKKAKEYHDGLHVHIFGVFNSVDEQVEAAKRFGGKLIDKGVEFDADGEDEDWRVIEFPSFEAANAFARTSKSWDPFVNIHHKDKKIFGV